MGRTHSDEGLSPIGGTLYEIGTISEEEEGGDKSHQMLQYKLA